MVKTAGHCPEANVVQGAHMRIWVQGGHTVFNTLY